MELKIAIIGCGMIADTHVNEIRKIEDTQIVAVCDREPLMAVQLAERYDIPSYFTDFTQLIRQCHPDIVHILTPPATHLSLGMAAIEAGCHVLMEKPFTLSADETITLINKAKSLERKIIVNHFHNFSPPSRRLRKMVSQGLLGDILHVEGFYSYNTKSPVASALIKDKSSWLHQLPGKVLQNNIDHLVGKIVEYIPDRQPSVCSCAKQIGEHLRKVEHSYIHDELRVMILGKTVSAYATFSSNISPFQHTMAVYGTRCSVTIDYESRAFIVTPTSSLPGPFGKLALPFISGKRNMVEGIKKLIDFGKSEYHFYAGANRLFKQFYQCIENNTDTPITYENMIKTAFIMDEIFGQINENHTRLREAM